MVTSNSPLPLPLPTNIFIAVQYWLSQDSTSDDLFGKSGDIMMLRQQVILAKDKEEAKQTIIEATELGLMNSIIAGEITPEAVIISVLDLSYELDKLEKGKTHYENQPLFKIVTRDVVAALGQ